MVTKSLGNFIVVDILKPLGVQADYDFCRVRKDYFVKARQQGKYVLVRTPNGEQVILPKLFMKKAKAIPEVMLYPDHPMYMYEVIVPHCIKKDNEYYSFR